MANCAWSAGHVHYSNPLRWRSGTCLFQRTTEREIVVDLDSSCVFEVDEISEVRSLSLPSSPACRSRRYDSDQQIHRRRFPSVARLLLSLAKLNALQGDQPAPVLTKVQTTDKKHMKNHCQNKQGLSSLNVVFGDTRKSLWSVPLNCLKASLFPLK